MENNQRTNGIAQIIAIGGTIFALVRFIYLCTVYYNAKYALVAQLYPNEINDKEALKELGNYVVNYTDAGIRLSSESNRSILGCFFIAIICIVLSLVIHRLGKMKETIAPNIEGMNMQCKQCGAFISNNSQFCSKCGAEVIVDFKHKELDNENMSDKYSILYSFPQNLYNENSPVIICAGALLKNNNTNTISLQLNFKNIQNKAIKALIIDVKCFDVAKKELQGVTDFQYLDLYIKRNDNFGENTHIILPDNVTRNVKFTIKKIVFSDDEIWINCINIFEPLPEEIPMTSLDKDIKNQFERQAGSKFHLYKYLPKKINGSWVCSCGIINNSYEQTCYGCNVDKDWIFRNTNPDVLKPLLDEYNTEQKRLLDEKQKNELLRREQERIKREEHQKKIKKFTIISVVSVLLLACIIFISTTINNKVIQPSKKYRDVMALLNENKFDAAINGFEDLGDYKDSKNKMLEAKYYKAMELLSERKYDYAISEFEALDDYQNSKSKVLEAKYDKAVDFLNNEKYDDASAAFSSLDDYKDSAEKLEQAQNSIKYNEGINLLSSGQYSSAISVFTSLGDFKDSAQKLNEAVTAKAAAEKAAAEKAAAEKAAAEKAAAEKAAAEKAAAEKAAAEKSSSQDLWSTVTIDNLQGTWDGPVFFGSKDILIVSGNYAVLKTVKADESEVYATYEGVITITDRSKTGKCPMLEIGQNESVMYITYINSTYFDSYGYIYYKR